MGGVGFVAQESPLYASLSVADHLRLGTHLNPGSDSSFARQRIADLGLDPSRPAGKVTVSIGLIRYRHRMESP
jgi:ABC-2 type transport system ATP-binding protein